MRLAQSPADREAACRLRFRVFNLELGKGLGHSWTAGLDWDRFDLSCDHLIVDDVACMQVVGTYRMQSGRVAAQNLGYYSQQEFDFSPYECVRSEVLELGRAAIDREHRTSEVLTLLWRGIAQYARWCGLRYLIGCSSLNAQDPHAAWPVYRELSPFLAPEPFRTRPARGYELPEEGNTCVSGATVPRLLRTYIAVGARICAEPAWDREFGTIDFLTLLDLARLSAAARHRFLPDTQFAEPPGSAAPCEPPCAC